MMKFSSTKTWLLLLLGYFTFGIIDLLVCPTWILLEIAIADTFFLLMVLSLISVLAAIVSFLKKKRYGRAVLSLVIYLLLSFVIRAALCMGTIATEGARRERWKKFMSDSETEWGSGYFEKSVEFVRGESLEAPKLQKFRERLETVIPSSARQIKAEIHKKGFSNQGRMTIVCYVEPETFKAFMQKRQLHLNYDSTFVNVQTNGPRVQWPVYGFRVSAYWDDEDANWSESHWSYTNISPNLAGERYVYFHEKGLLIYDWSSN